MRQCFAARRAAVPCAIAALVGLVAGCRKPASDGSAVPAPAPPVRIVAYINVSSGCQEPTVELLKNLARQYRGRVTVDLVDFGDEGEGERRWKESGYDCMTIEIDGSPLVRFRAGEQEKVVALQQPVGFAWTHEDLQAAVAAAVNGTLGRGTEEEALAGRPPRKVKAEIVTEEVTREGKAFARVLINERPAMAIRTGSDGKSPAQRAEAAAEVLREWTSVPIAPNQIDRVEAPGGWAVRVDKKVVAVATEADAKAAGGTPDQLAKKWLVGIRQGIAIAARPPQAGAAEGGETASEDDCETGG